MDFIVRCMSCFRANEHKVEHAKSIRNNWLTGFERVNMGLNILMLFFGFLMVVTGVAFISNDLMSPAQFALKKVKNGATALVICYMLLVPIFGASGIMIVRRRQCHSFILAIWATLLFFIIAIPLMAEGSVYLAIDKMSDQKIVSLCDKSISQVRDEGYSRVATAIRESADRFDLWSEQLLDSYMCSSTCPCLDYDTQKGSTKDIFAADVTLLTNHNRTFSSMYDKQKMIHMNFTKDEMVGGKKVAFRSMLECLSHYEELERAGNNTDMEKVFTVNVTEFIKNEQDPNKDKMDDLPPGVVAKIMEKYLKEIDWYLILEDEYDCSGMCTPSLFYFSKDLASGPPKQTCLLATKKYMSTSSGSFAVTSTMTGVVALFLFFFHFCLYCRPPQDDENYGNNEHGVDPNAVEIQLQEN